jgi:hypothetical protein
MSTVAWMLTLVLVGSFLPGCASSAPPPPTRPIAVGLEGLHRVVVVASGETRFAVAQPSKEPGPALDDVLKWLPYKEILVPIARAVYHGVTWLMNANGGASGAPRDVTPGAVVAEAFARSLQLSGPFHEVVALEREPVGEARRNVDAIVRLTVPAWGLVSVRDGDAPLVAGFADVRAQMVARESGVVLWEHEEDVTHPERLSFEALKQDRALSREELIEVLERAGRRLATELIYARGRAQ